MSKKKYDVFHMDDESMQMHCGHTLILQDVWSWQENRQTGIELRCVTCGGDGGSDEEPLFEMDFHKDHPCRI